MTPPPNPSFAALCAVADANSLTVDLDRAGVTYEVIVRRKNDGAQVWSCVAGVIDNLEPVADQGIQALARRGVK